MAKIKGHNIMKRGFEALKDFLMINPWDVAADIDYGWWLTRGSGGTIICIVVMIVLVFQGDSGKSWSIANVASLNAITFALACWIGR